MFSSGRKEPPPSAHGFNRFWDIAASLELDHQGQIITYEEYAPYGSSTYQAVSSQTETAKRYRYTGKERDEESGLYYHGARYYAPWIGRWTAADSAKTQEQANRFEFCFDNPIRFNDPTGKQPPPSPATTMSQEQRAAWASAETRNYDDESVRQLISVIETERSARGQDLVTRGSAVGYATVRASAAARNWEQGNYGRALIHGTAGVIESVGYAMLGDTHAQSARNAVIIAGTSIVIGAGVGYATGGSNASVSVAFRPGTGSSPARVGPGHNMVGVNTGSGTQWSHLVVDEAQATSGIVTGGRAIVVPAPKGPGPGYSTVEVPVSPAQASRALSTAEAQVATGDVGAYKLACTDCSSYAGTVVNAAGVATPPVTTPALNYLSVTLQSPAVTAPLLSVSTAVTLPPVINQVTQREEALQMSLPEEHETR